mgnify:CR=1 FL=1
MKNTITISVQDDFWENRCTTVIPHSLCRLLYRCPIPTIYAGTGTNEYEIIHCPKRLLSAIGRKPDHLTLHAGDAIFYQYRNVTFSGNDQATKDFYKEDLVFHGRLIYSSKHTVFWQKYMAPIATSSISLPYIHLTPAVPMGKRNHCSGFRCYGICP